MATDNRYESLRTEAIADCKAGRYADAERKLRQLLDVLQSQRAPINSSPTMYWYLVAVHAGNEKKAMDEFTRLEDT